MKKLLLVDGNSMLFRAYYATAYGQRMSTPQGLPTNAVFGFASMLQKALELTQPDSVLVAFDAGKHTFRHELYADYKGGRKPAPDDLIPQFQMVRDYLDAFHIRWVEMPDIEADDLIGSMSRQSGDYDTVIFSSDHDLLQLIDDSTTVMLMKKGITEMSEMTVNALKEEMGITPLQIIELKGLMGDHSDNIPGIPGVGEKTALKLLSEYGTVEEVIAHADEIKGALGKKVQAGKDSALLSKTLATIKTDVPLAFTAADCAFAPDYASLIRFFESLNMRSLAKRYQELAATESGSGSSTPAAETVAFEQVTVCPKDVLEGDLAIYFDADKEPFYQSVWNGIAIRNRKRAVYLTLEDAKQDTALLDTLSHYKDRIIGFDIKKNMHLSDRYHLPLNFTDDVMIAANLVHSALTSPEKIFEAYGLTDTMTYEEIYGTPARPKLPDPADVVRFACEKAGHIMELYQATSEAMTGNDLEKLYQTIELPLTKILFEMERTGIRCDANVLRSIADEMKTQIDTLQNEVFTLAGHDFNLNSPKQLAEVLYDELGLPSGKKRSTGADVLEKLVELHPIISSLLSYRKLQKIYSTYAEGLQKYIQKDGRIHTLYNQCATQTGRLSSSDPNLQNISVRDEQGRIIRKAFLPEEGHVLLSSDYHQIELRMLASMADEDSMIDAFNHDIDIHTKTAMDVFGVEQDDVTKEMRRRAKTVNFGIVYGISDFGLAEQLGISRKEAAEFIATYYEKYPKIRTYMDSLVSFCEQNGYVLTVCGRRREIPEIKDKNRMIREFGKRAAMNAPIQGSAADLIKIAMLHIDAMMKEAKVKSQMLLQVHDELIFDVPADEVEQMKQLVTEGMVKAMELKVPLTVECSIGNDWYEAK